jgi:hypothetical protein
MGRMDSPSLLSSNRKQLDSVSASVHFKPIISLRRSPNRPLNQQGPDWMPALHVIDKVTRT